MSTITTINSSDNISSSRTVINTNFSNLNTDKIETSTLDTDTTLAANSDTKIATQKAVKAYIDTSGGANASTTVRGIVEEATAAEIVAATATGGTGARLFINPSTLPIPTITSFTASGTWTKPAGLVAAVVEVWGAGGSGGRKNANFGGGGGGGGSYVRTYFQASQLGATETVTIGAGGAAVSANNTAGNVGGDTTFGSLVTARGGGGGGGGTLGAGFAPVTDATGGRGGRPSSLVSPGPGGVATAGADVGQDNSMGGGGGSAITSGGYATWGGGGGGNGGSTDGGVGGNSLNGGAGGGGANQSGAGAAGGTSSFGGNGGAGGGSGAAVAGTQPGGGGGGGFNANSGAGANGKVIVYEFK
jgi:hypothetical protein